MDVTVSSRHTEVPEHLRKVAEDKIGRLDRFVEGMDRAEVHFSEEGNPRIAAREICEVTLHGHGHHVRCKVRAPDGFAAVDLAVEKLEHQLHKLKTKLVRRHHGGPKSARVEPGALTTSLIDEEMGTNIVKTKRFVMTPMTAAEAAMQMELLGHDFFFFANIETTLTGVVYRRTDGTVGLIDEEPRV